MKEAFRPTHEKRPSNIPRETFPVQIMNTPPKPPLTEAEEARRGRYIAESLALKRDQSFPDRWLTDWGNKTDLGLFRTLKRFIEEGK